MCLNPKKILNRTNHFDETKPLYLEVPCGKCAECCSRSRNDWFVRAWFEWVKSPMRSFFYTLTYNNACLPRFHGKPCFSKRHVQLFLKRLRKELAPIKVKYLITSEYGEKYGRPHYHVDFFLSGDVAPWQFYKIVEKSWQYGFVQYGNKDGALGVIKSAKGLAYVTKYITKDWSYINTNANEELVAYSISRYNTLASRLFRRLGYGAGRFLHLFSDDNQTISSHYNKDLGDDEFEELCRRITSKARAYIRERQPFHLQSSRLGIPPSNYFSEQSLLHEIVQLPDDKGGAFTYAMPRYYKRLFWYDVVENEIDGKKTRYVLNEAGLKHALDRLDIRIEQEELRLKNVFLDLPYIDEDTLRIVNETSSIVFPNVPTLQFYLQNFDLPLHSLAVYSVCFRGRLIPKSLHGIDLNDQLVEDSYHDYVRWCLYESTTYDYGKIFETYGKETAHVFRFSTWDNHPFFHVFDDAITILDAVSLNSRILRAKAAEEKDRKRRALKEILDKLSNS